MQKVRAKKSLGQHFLTDLSVAQRIADTLAPFKGMPVLEVGPGMGVLTQFLLEAGHDLTVVELDHESVEYLRLRFPDLTDRIIEQDFLRMDLRALYGERKFCVIGNYPYNISSQIFFKVLDYRDQVAAVAGMLQREVAQRIVSPPGSKVYGILSVMLQAWYDAGYLFTVDENVFDPPPKVKSGVILLTRNERQALPCDEKRWRQVIKTAFGQRRKTLRNSLRPLLGERAEQFAQLPVAALRPEQLSVEQFIELTQLLNP